MHRATKPRKKDRMKASLKNVVVGLSAAALLATSLAGCSSSGSVGGTGGVNSLEKITENGTFVVGVKFDTRPYGFVPEGQSEPAGFDIDLATEIADRLGVEVELVQVNSQNRILNLESGKVDALMASMLRTPEREETIDFSIDYLSDGQMLLVPEDSKITSIDDLGSDTTVAVVQGTPEEKVLLENAPEGVKTVTYQSWPDALQSLYRNEAQAVTTTLGILYGLKESSDDAGKPMEIVGGSFADGPIAAGFRKGDSELIEAFNDALLDMQEDGTYEEIFLKWWGDAIPEVYVMQR